MKTKWILLVFSIILMIAACRNQADEFTVMKGNFRQSFMETGELDAISSIAIMMPRIRWEYGYEFKIISLTETGKLVKAGDTVIRIDPSTIEKVIDEILANNQGQVEQYKSGKQQVFGFFVGQTMKAMKGKANPKVVNEVLQRKLSS